MLTLGDGVNQKRVCLRCRAWELAALVNGQPASVSPIDYSVFFRMLIVSTSAYRGGLAHHEVGRTEGSMDEGKDWMRERGDEDRPTLACLLLFLTTTSMGLDNLPVPCTCGKRHSKRQVRDGRTHDSDAPCPFAADDFPTGAFATCCSLRGKAAAYELDALSEVDLSNRMYDTMTAEEARAFAQELRQAANRLEQKHANDNPKPKGAWDNETFEQALAWIRQAADWYEKVAKLGFGVNAWY